LDKSELLRQLRIDRDAPQGAGAARVRVWAGLAAAVVVIGGAVAWLVLREPVAAVTVAVAQPMPESSAGASVLDATGYVTARRQATVSAKITGKVREVMIEEGQRVEAGDVMATLDDAEAQVDLELRRAELRAARAQLAEAKAASANAEREFRRQQELADLKLTSIAALDAARTGAEASRARVASQEGAVQVAQEGVRAAEVQVDNTIVRAPFAGVVTVKAAQPGEMISPISGGEGSTVRTGIGTVVDMDSLEVQVDVSEAYINRVRPGQKVEAVLNAYPDWRIPASVIAIVPTADRSKATVKVRIALQDKDTRIVPEMGVRVAFLEERGAANGGARPASRGVLVPVEAVREEGGRSIVYLVRDGRAERRAVTVGGTFGGNREVRAGVSSGERVIVEASENLKDGDAVEAHSRGES
jgi:RND family efflux transporter MFP subunit